jgi:hypothetical protein
MMGPNVTDIQNFEFYFKFMISGINYVKGEITLVTQKQ